MASHLANWINGHDLVRHSFLFGDEHHIINPYAFHMSSSISTASRTTLKPRGKQEASPTAKGVSPETTSLQQQALATTRISKKPRNAPTPKPLDAGGLDSNTRLAIYNLEAAIAKEEDDERKAAQTSEKDGSADTAEWFYSPQPSSANTLFEGVDQPIPAPTIELIGPVEYKSESHRFDTPEQRTLQTEKNGAPPTPRLGTTKANPSNANPLFAGVDQPIPAPTIELIGPVEYKSESHRFDTPEQRTLQTKKKGAPPPPRLGTTKAKGIQHQPTVRIETVGMLERDYSLVPMSKGGGKVFRGKTKNNRYIHPKLNSADTIKLADAGDLSPMERFNVVQRFSKPLSEQCEKAVTKQFEEYSKTGDPTGLRLKLHSIEEQGMKFKSLLNQSQQSNLKVTPKRGLFGLFSRPHRQNVDVAQTPVGINAENGAHLKPFAEAIIQNVDKLAKDLNKHGLDNTELLQVKNELRAALERGFVQVPEASVGPAAQPKPLAKSNGTP